MAGEVTNTTGINAGTYTGNSTTGVGKSSLGKDDFFKLMMAQLKNQDPLSPMDGTDFAAQLAQFSSLEQLSNMNENLQKSIDANYLLTQSVNNTMTATLIGKEVKLSGANISYSGQDNVNLGYNLPADAQSFKISIYDKNGNLVKTIEPSEKGLGEHKLTWDFTDDNGHKVAAGDYSFKVTAKGTNGSDLTVNAYKWGTINAVRFSDSGTNVVIGKIEYPISDITEIIGEDNGGVN